MISLRRRRCGVCRADNRVTSSLKCPIATVFSPASAARERPVPALWRSGASAACTVFSGEANPNACDQDQGSDPIVGPDGTIYVSFGNGNTPVAGINQVMIVSCPANKVCSSAANWTAPVKVSDLFDFSIYVDAHTEDIARRVPSQPTTARRGVPSTAGAINA